MISTEKYALNLHTGLVIAGHTDKPKPDHFYLSYPNLNMVWVLKCTKCLQPSNVIVFMFQTRFCQVASKFDFTRCHIIVITTLYSRLIECHQQFKLLFHRIIKWFHWKFSRLLRNKWPGSTRSLVIRCDSNFLEHQLVSVSHKASASLWSSGFLFSAALRLIMKLLEEVSRSLTNINCHYQMCGFSRESPVIGQVLPTRTNGSIPYCIIIGAWEDVGYFSWKCHATECIPESG